AVRSRNWATTAEPSPTSPRTNRADQSLREVWYALPFRTYACTRLPGAGRPSSVPLPPLHRPKQVRSSPLPSHRVTVTVVLLPCPHGLDQVGQPDREGQHDQPEAEQPEDQPAGPAHALLSHRGPAPTRSATPSAAPAPTPARSRSRSTPPPRAAAAPPGRR